MQQFTTLFLSLDPVVQGAFIGASGIGVGALVNTISNVFINREIRRSEDRRLIADLVAKLALEQWKFDCEASAKAVAEARNAALSGAAFSRTDFFQISAPTVAEVTRNLTREVEAIYHRPGIFVRAYRHLWNNKAEQAVPGNRPKAF